MLNLKEARVENYRSITDTGSFRIDDLTCLVGKNESGKTAVLKALHRLNPDDVDESEYDVEIEYPRQHLFAYQPHHATDPARVVSTRWELDDAAVEWVQDRFGPNVLGEREITITKGYDNVQTWMIDLDERQAVVNLITDADIDERDAEKLKDVTTVQDLIQQVAGLEESPRQQAFLARLQESFGDRDVTQVVMDYLDERVPTFVYYANYNALPGRVSLEQFLQLDAQQQLGFPQKMFRALLSLVNVTPNTVSDAETYENLKAKLEAIGLQLSTEIFKYWTTNRDLEVDFDFRPGRPGDEPPFDSGYVFHTRIKNKRHGVSVSFDERSTGFVWFFSFLVWFSQMQREHGDNLVLLLDEPGLSLHGTAQADLLRFIKEELVSKYQVIYTTHSPFMIDPGDLLSVRTVEDVVDGNDVLGTKVGDEVLSTDAETLFPLRAALGYEVTQTLFVGEHNLLVEGPSDLLYLRWASEQLRKRGRTSLDRRWTIAVCGGLGKIGSFLSLFGAHLHVAVLTDFASGEKGAVRSLREQNLLRDGQVLSAEMFVDGQDEADVEDLIGRRLYVEVVNKAFELPGPQRLKATAPADAPIRVVKEVEDHFRTLPAEAPEFDHYTPADYLLEHAADFESAKGIDDAIDRFEELFETLNAFLED